VNKERRDGPGRRLATPIAARPLAGERNAASAKATPHRPC
jgi:hypothetical protein